MNHARLAGTFAVTGRNLVTPAILLALMSPPIAARPAAQQPPAAVPMHAVDVIADAFKTHQVVMLPGGHGSRTYHEFLLQLVRDPRLHGVVNDIVVEFGSSRYQDLMERFLRGEEIPFGTLKQAWQNTVVAGVTNDGPYVEDFYRSMRALNASLPPQRRYRVLLGDPPIDWDHVTDKADVRRWVVLRSTYPADLIRREVIARGRRALVVYGQLHFPRKEMQTNYDMSDWQAQTITSWLEQVPETKVFVTWSEGGDAIVKLQPEIASWPRLSMARVRGTVIGAADFTALNGDRERFAIQGVDTFVKIPRSEHKAMRVEDLIDAIIWNGNAPPNPVLLSAETCADPGYLPMRLKRIALAGIPPGEGEAAKRACAAHAR